LYAIRRRTVVVHNRLLEISPLSVVHWLSQDGVPNSNTFCISNYFRFLLQKRAGRVPLNQRRSVRHSWCADGTRWRLCSAAGAVSSQAFAVVDNASTHEGTEWYVWEPSGLTLSYEL